MKKTAKEVEFVLEMVKMQAILSRRFDSGLNGLGLNEFTILYNLSIAKDQKLRRIDLAGKIGLTASGVTRLLLPMEKIGLVKSGASENDARERHVMIAPGGKRKLEEATERMELLMDELIPKDKSRKIGEMIQLMTALSDRAQIN